MGRFLDSKPVWITDRIACNWEATLVVMPAYKERVLLRRRSAKTLEEGYWS